MIESPDPGLMLFSSLKGLPFLLFSVKALQIVLVTGGFHHTLLNIDNLYFKTQYCSLTGTDRRSHQWPLIIWSLETFLGYILQFENTKNTDIQTLPSEEKRLSA